MQPDSGRLLIESAFVYDFSSEGKTIEIDYVNPSEEMMNMEFKKAVFLFSEKNRVSYPKNNKAKGAAITVDADMMVIKVAEDIHYVPEAELGGAADLRIPEGGFLLLALEEGKQEAGCRKFFTENFKPGDLVRLRRNRTAITVRELIDYGPWDRDQPILRLEQEESFTTLQNKMLLKGTVIGTVIAGQEDYCCTLVIRRSSGEDIPGFEKELFLRHKGMPGQFTYEIELKAGINYIDVFIKEGSRIIEASKRSIAVYYKEPEQMKPKQLIMWVEQYVNAEALNSPEKIESMVKRAKEASVTDFAVDVKGCEGYAAYRKATFSHTPYMTQTRNPKKKISMEIDFLEEFIKISHKYGIKVHASFNFFAEGMIGTEDYAMEVPKLHPEWAESLQAPEDQGEIRDVLSTRRAAAILYVNPANEEVQKLQLKRAEEVLLNYDVDGIIMDRTRYDHQYADFSETSRQLFEQYLKQQDKVLKQWPEEVYQIHRDGSIVTGRYYHDWLAFRSTVIRDFSALLHKLVVQYKNKKDKEIRLGAYVGAWYDSYYQNGVNWASKDFHYNSRLKFPASGLYTEDYYKTSYLSNLDFLMIGCYFENPEQIGRYVTLGNILTRGETALIGGISLLSHNSPAALEEALKQVNLYSDGAMIFDLCYTDWEVLRGALQAD